MSFGNLGRRFGGVGRLGLLGRASNARGADIILILYGQSNMLYMSSVSSSPPAANAGTVYWADGAWGAVPGGNGIRELLNAINDATGLTVGAIQGSVSGVPVASLLKGAGTGYYEALADQITASGGFADYVLIHHGEGDADASPVTSEANFKSRWDTIHGDLATDFGKTKATLPMVMASLATDTGLVGNTDAAWDSIQRAIMNCATDLTGVTYSHSNMDAVLQVDGVHFSAVSYGRAGKRYARTVNTIRGVTSGYPKWSIASGAVVDGTTTTIDLTHGPGTDFTPTSGITGFEASGDNGSSWVSCTGVRTSATRITLTHASIATTSARKIRYQFGKAPDVSAPVVDNSSLAVPLLLSAGNLSPTPLAALPVPTFQSRGATSSSGQNQTRASITVDAGSAEKLAIISVTVANGTGTGGTQTMNVAWSGSPTNAATFVKDQRDANASSFCVWLWQIVLPSGTTSIDVTMNFAHNPFVTSSISVWTVPTSDLSSTTPVDAQAGLQAAGTTVDISPALNTTSDGFIIAVGGVKDAGAQAASISDPDAVQTYAERFDIVSAGGRHVGADTSAVATDADNDARLTLDNSGRLSLVAAAWR
jgi:hypothetical protein